MSRNVVRALLLCLLVVGIAGVFLTPRLDAQVLYGSLLGTVADQSGAVVPKVQVTITNKETGATRETATDEAGRYSFLNVLAGTYNLKVAAGGFRPFSQTDISIVINIVARVDVKLEVGAVTEAITVAATATLLTTEKSDVHAELGTKAVTNLPLATYRNYQSLINLVPGATPAMFQNAVVDTPARALTTNVNGTARNNNNTRLDGATNIYIWLPHHSAYVAPVESIETVNITTGSFDAEQGMAGGAAVTVATKSGTNEYHGVGFWFHDNQHLRARNYFLRTPQKPKSIFNIRGGTLGGPIVKNKLFFFGSYEGTYERSGIAGIWSLPPADQRRGDFSAYQSLRLIYDPLTGARDGSGRVPFANNTIPLARQSAISRKIQDSAPPPNLPGTDLGTLSNFTNSGTEKLNRNNYDIKVNWNPATAHSFFGKYSRMDALVNSGFALGAVGGPGLSRAGVGNGDTTVQLATAGHTWIFSPTFLMDTTFGYTRFDQIVAGPDHGKNWGSEVWGIPGTNGPDIRQSGMPIINHGYTSWGNIYGWMPLFRNDRSFTYTTNVSKTRGAHDLRWGFDLIRHHMDHWQPELASGPRGSFDFGAATACSGRDANGNACASPNYLHSYASFLLGLPNSATKAVQNLYMTNREWQFGWYFRDRWQVTRNLTVNLGLRYEYYPLITREDRGIERWDPATNKVYLGRIGGNPDNVGIIVSKKLFGPRVGFAYRLGDKMVIRSGYGITYDPIPFSRPLRGLYPSTIAATFPAENSYVAFQPFERGIPPIPVPDISKGVVDLPPTVDMGPRSAWAGPLHRGYIQSWNFTVERRLPADFVTSVAYVGTQTVHQLADLDINAAAPGAGAAGRPLAATQGRRIGANMWDGWVSSNYHSMQIAINRQFSKGLMAKGAYTWSKAINMTDDTGWAGMPETNWLPALGRNRAPAGYDRTHMFAMGFVYELPFGPGKTWAQTGPASYVLRGWQTNGTFSSYTGRPFTIRASGASLNAPGSNQTADQVKSKVEKIGKIGFGESFFDPTAFKPVSEVRFGSTGRNVLRSPGMVNLNFSLFRTFTLTERFRLEFKAEAFNLSNTPAFGYPGGNVSSAAFNPDGSIRSLGGFSSVTSTIGDYPERQFRFGVRLTF